MSSLTEEQKRRIEENKRKALARRAQKTSPIKQSQGPQTLNSVKNADHRTTSNVQQSQGPVSKTLSSSSSSSIQTGVQSGNKSGDGGKFQTSGSHLHIQSNVQSSQSKPSGIQSSFNSMQSQRHIMTWTNSIKSGTSNHQLVKEINKNSISGKETMTSISGTSGSTSNTFGAQKPVVKFGSNVKGKCVLISRERFEVQVGFSALLVEVFKSVKTKLYDAVTKKWSFKLEDYDVLVSAVNKLGPAVVLEPLPKAVLQTFSAQLKGKYPPREIPTADLSHVDSSLVNSLLPFQREAVNFGVQRNGRVLIADDMGLGKTIQAICLACVYRREWPVLIVVPSSVRFDWAQQIQRWVPSLDPQEIFVAVKGSDGISSSLVNILSYDLMARKAKELVKKGFQVIIMDECHLLKNYKTARCKAAMPLLQKAQRVILLSGTPALSRPSELYTQISAVCPFMFKYHDFGVRYCDGKQNPWGWDFSGSSNMEELQLVLEERIMIRRLKKDVLTQLPSKVRQMVVLDPGSIKTTKDMKRSSKVMGLDKLKGMDRRCALLDYFHQTGNAKLQAVIDYVVDLLESDRKFILFAHHQEVLDGVEQAVSAKVGNVYIRIDGRTTPEQRNFFCKKFQTNDDVKVAILSITAANAGLNMAAANLVVFAELFWNPGILVQAEDRAHRLGQRDMVSVQYLVAQGTADDHIWPLVQKKLDVLNKGGLSKDDFSSADTVRIRDSKQTDLMQYFEESFIEEDDSLIVEDTEEIPSDSATCIKETQKKVSITSSKCVADSSKPKQGSLFNYYNAQVKSTTTMNPVENGPSSSKVNDKHQTEEEFLEDAFADDLDPFSEVFEWGECNNEPDIKKKKLCDRLS